MFSNISKQVPEATKGIVCLYTVVNITFKGNSAYLKAAAEVFLCNVLQLLCFTIKACGTLALTPHQPVCICLIIYFRTEIKIT